MKTRHLIALVFLVLCGCVSTPKYVEPTQSDAATLRFINKSDGYFAPLWFVNAKDCSGGIQGFTTDASKVLIGKNSFKAMKIEPNKAFSFWISYTTKPGMATLPDKDKMYCKIIGTFTPKSSGSYSATVTSTSTTCSVSLTETVDGVERPDPSFEKRAWKEALNGAGSHCQ
ncbi:hypothetical protein [Andreprevotia chitinilytica]|uniref:hypothetical protein n=1 Tax=Andreprevotia chitinilytica TaxID=396808 RepID=UPI0012EB0A9F|nr:hypothetical protein [Andreprevotia chitinilytica]